MNLFDVKGKNAVILGGGGVLGNAMVRGLASAGARVAICGRTESKAKALAQELITDGAVAKGYGVDASSAESLKSLQAKIAEDFGHVDILVSAVGGNAKEATTSDTVTFFELNPEAIKNVAELNLMAGAVLPAQVFGKAMAESEQGGVIINITSMSAFKPLTRILGYSAAKAAVSNFTQWLAVYFAQAYGEKVRVNAIAPGFFLTEQNRFLLTNPETGELTPRGRSIIQHTPMGRFGKPEELVGTLLWLASDASRFVTGIVVPVDGGFSAFSGV